MNSPIAELKDISVRYNSDITVLKDINISLRPGAVSGIIGPNGAGKSTVLKTLACMLKPQSGSIIIESEAVTGLPSHALVRRGVAMVPQSRSLFLDLSVEDNLRLGCWTFRRDKARVARVLDMVHSRFPFLKERGAAAAGALSGGQRRFLEIGRALLLEPRILLLDEPTAMVAPLMVGDIYRTIRELADEGIAIGLVDQNVRGCVDVADYIYVLELGRNSVEGSQAEFSGSGKLNALISSWLEFSGG